MSRRNGRIVAVLVGLVPALILGALLGERLGLAPPFESQPTYPPDDPAPHVWTQSPRELDILEAVFRYQLTHNASSATNLGRVGFYALSLGDGEARQDPPQELLARFAGDDPPVVPASACEAGMSGVTHPEHEGQGVLLRVESIREIDEKTVDVDGGYYEASRSASGNTYRLQCRDGRWTCTRAWMHWIS